MGRATGAQATGDPDRIREHYEIERELASRLRQASREARRELYTRVYDELFEQMPHHPQLLRRNLPADTQHRVQRQLANFHRALAVGGVYICVTPNRLGGPQDISQHFDQVRGWPWCCRPVC